MEAAKSGQIAKVEIRAAPSAPPRTTTKQITVTRRALYEIWMGSDLMKYAQVSTNQERRSIWMQIFISWFPMYCWLIGV